MSQISDILKIFPLKSRTYENGYKNYSANCFCKFKGLQLTFQVVWKHYPQRVGTRPTGRMERQPYSGDVRDDERALVAPYLTLITEDAPRARIACGRSSMTCAGSSARGPRGG
jgi:hypothetical protein